MTLQRFLAALLLVGTLSAAPMVVADDEAVKERIAEALTAIDPDLAPDRIESTPLPGIYRVVVGSQVAHITEDGRYLIQGDILDLETRQSIAEVARGEVRRERIEAHGEDRMILYAPDGESRHTVTVFTDIDCPYCRQMHQDMDDYLERGITVRYIQMPRAGVGSDSYHKAVSVWCADDRHAAMDRAKAGETPERRECDNPVREQLELARELNVNATPTFVTEQGTVHRGLIAPAELAERLDAEADGG